MLGCDLVNYRYFKQWANNYFEVIKSLEEKEADIEAILPQSPPLRGDKKTFYKRQSFSSFPEGVCPEDAAAATDKENPLQRINICYFSSNIKPPVVS